MHAKDVLGIIRNKIEDYENIISELERSKEDDHVRETLNKYTHYVVCLSELNRQLFPLIEFYEHVIFETLRQNYEKNDTEFIFIDDSSYTVKKDDICIFKDNYILIQNKEEFKEAPTVIPSTEKAINLDNVKLVKTLHS